MAGGCGPGLRQGPSDEEGTVDILFDAVIYHLTKMYII